MKRLFNFCVKWEPMIKFSGEHTNDFCAGAANQKPEKVADDYDVFLYRTPWHQKIMRWSRPDNQVCLRNCVCGCRAGLGDKRYLESIRDKDWFPPTYFEGEDCSEIVNDKELYFQKNYTLEAATGIAIYAGNRLPRILKENKVPEGKLIQKNIEPHLFDIEYNGSHPDFIDKDFYKNKKYSIRIWTLVSDKGDIAVMKDYHYKFALFKHKTNEELVKENVKPKWFHVTNSCFTRDIKMSVNSYDDLKDREKHKDIEQWWNDPLGGLKAQYSVMRLNDDPNFFVEEAYPLMCEYIKEYVDNIIHLQEIPECIEGRTWTTFGMDFMFDKNRKLYFIEANQDPGYKLFEPSDKWYIEWWNNVSNLIRKDDTSMWTMMKSKNKMTITNDILNEYNGTPLIYEDDARTFGYEIARAETSFPGAEPW